MKICLQNHKILAKQLRELKKITATNMIEQSVVESKQTRRIKRLHLRISKLPNSRNLKSSSQRLVQVKLKLRFKKPKY